MTDREQLSELATRRGFYFPAEGIYGGVAGFYTYGPLGAGLKRNIENAWRERFLTREGHMELDGPTVMAEPVFEASGHLDGFDDMIVACPECEESHRADHLIEDATDIEEADSLPVEEVAELLAEHGIACPACGADLAGEEVSGFNLMFDTNIGPGDSAPGYLRPETAQAIFVEFPRLAEYARNQLPFGVGQIGKAYRNEISPRRGLIRTREFTQAELEHFVDPDRNDPNLDGVRDVPLTLYPISEQQAENGEYIETTVGEALSENVIESPWIAYYLGIATEWYERIGVDMDRFRYRQHLPGERAHYAVDCWDAEAELGGNWIEITGFSTRSDYDLAHHADRSGESMTVFEAYDDPRVEERPTVEPDMSALGPQFGDRAPRVVDALENRVESDPDAFAGETIDLELDGETHSVAIEDTGFAVREERVSGEHVRPHVIEPSFGVDRLFATVFEHAFREDTVDGEDRTYLAFPSETAPTFVGVFPLMDKDGMGERARAIDATLRERGVRTQYDDSGSIGRRYRRQDEVGTPFCITVDYETIEENGSVTLRDRDSGEQVRIGGENASGIDEILGDLRAGRRTFEDLANGSHAGSNG